MIFFVLQNLKTDPSSEEQKIYTDHGLSLFLDSLGRNTHEARLDLHSIPMYVITHNEGADHAYPGMVQEAVAVVNRHGDGVAEEEWMHTRRQSIVRQLPKESAVLAVTSALDLSLPPSFNSKISFSGALGQEAGSVLLGCVCLMLRCPWLRLFPSSTSTLSPP